jgi:hypothetical protein
VVRPARARKSTKDRERKKDKDELACDGVGEDDDNAADEAREEGVEEAVLSRRSLASDAGKAMNRFAEQEERRASLNGGEVEAFPVTVRRQADCKGEREEEEGRQTVSEVLRENRLVGETFNGVGAA